MQNFLTCIVDSLQWKKNMNDEIIEKSTSAIAISVHYYHHESEQVVDTKEIDRRLGRYKSWTEMASSHF